MRAVCVLTLVYFAIMYTLFAELIPILKKDLDQLSNIKVEENVYQIDKY